MDNLDLQSQESGIDVILDENEFQRKGNGFVVKNKRSNGEEIEMQNTKDDMEEITRETKLIMAAFQKRFLYFLTLSLPL